MNVFTPRDSVFLLSVSERVETSPRELAGVKKAHEECRGINEGEQTISSNYFFIIVTDAFHDRSGMRISSLMCEELI